MEKASVQQHVAVAEDLDLNDQTQMLNKENELRRVELDIELAQDTLDELNGLCTRVVKDVYVQERMNLHLRGLLQQRLQQLGKEKLRPQPEVIDVQPARVFELVD